MLKHCYVYVWQHYYVSNCDNYRAHNCGALLNRITQPFFFNLTNIMSYYLKNEAGKATISLIS